MDLNVLIEKQATYVERLQDEALERGLVPDGARERAAGDPLGATVRNYATAVAVAVDRLESLLRLRRQLDG